VTDGVAEGVETGSAGTAVGLAEIEVVGTIVADGFGPEDVTQPKRKTLKTNNAAKRCITSLTVESI